MTSADPEIQAFNQLFSGYKSRFARFADTYVRNLPVAQDIALEAFIYYWENRRSLPPDSNIPACILATIKHKCLNHLERERLANNAAISLRRHAAWELSARISTLKACDPEEIFRSDMQLIIRRTLMKLPDKSRNIFVMCRYRNASYKDAAALLGVGEKTVEYHIAKVMKALRKSLEDYLS
ncbi:MAG: RNA polymerase sigma-70 factor [Tannerellaceae bacterium]|jgi:RNA polymerase sigma-70 factor (ECF subfamily)|nr:RNA polymerase sigma-70 factor [Tannerellaceae bacterium]